MTREEIQERIEKLGPWFHRIELGEGLVTKTGTPAAIARQTLADVSPTVRSRRLIATSAAAKRALNSASET